MEQFFPEQRRRLILTGVALKRNNEDEKRIKLDFEMPLTGQPLEGMSKEVAAAFEAVAKLDNGITEAAICSEIKGQTLEIFDTDKSRKRNLLVVGADLQKLSVFRPKSEAGPRDDVSLSFSTTIPYSAAAWTWAPEYAGATFYATFETVQASLPGTQQPAQDAFPTLPPEQQTAVEAHA
jgi:hypothetical protein